MVKSILNRDNNNNKKKKKKGGKKEDAREKLVKNPAEFLYMDRIMDGKAFPTIHNLMG